MSLTVLARGRVVVVISFGGQKVRTIENEMKVEPDCDPSIDYMLDELAETSVLPAIDPR